MKDFIAQLRTRAWKTAGSRYNAARRLKQRETFSVCSLALLSALSVAAAVAQRIYSPQPGTPLDNYLTSASIALGVLLLAVSLLKWGAAYGAKSETLHRNAEELTDYQGKLSQQLAHIDQGHVPTFAEVDLLRIEYETIKGRCSHNHKPLDHRMFLSEHRHSVDLGAQLGKPLMNGWQMAWTFVRWQWSTVWFFLLVWLAVVATTGAVYFFIPKM